MEKPTPAPGSAPLRLPPPEQMAELPLFGPRQIEPGLLPPPGFRMKLPQPAKWKRPSSWILPLMLVLAAVAWLVWRLPHGELLPPPDDRLPTIVVDAGHGGHDTGATGNGLVEKDLALDTALRLAQQLQRRGFPVRLTRSDDTFLPLFDRSQVANALPHALFVSIHYNDNTTTGGDGVETFYAAQKASWMFASLRPDQPPDDGSFAQTVQSAVVGALHVTDRGSHARQLAVVRYARCPAVLVEGGFINNPWEAQKIAQPAYREALAAAIAEGIAKYEQQSRPRPVRDPRVAKQ